MIDAKLKQVMGLVDAYAEAREDVLTRGQSHYPAVLTARVAIVDSLTKPACPFALLPQECGRPKCRAGVCIDPDAAYPKDAPWN